MSAPAVDRDRDIVTWLGLAVVGTAAAVLSFSALSDLARLCGITGEITVGGWTFRLAWLLPMTVDILAAVATRVWLRREAAPAALRFARWSAWSAIAATVVGNAAHGVLVDLQVPAPWVAVVVVSAVPAAALGTLVHLGVLVGRDPGGPELDRAELRAAAGAAGVPVQVETPTTTVYRLYDEVGALLYVGITSDLTARLAHHRRSKAWWPEVARTVIRTYPLRDQALAVEQHIIEADQPRHNVQPGSLRDAVTAAASRLLPSAAAVDGAPVESLDDRAARRSVDASKRDDVLAADLRAWADEVGSMPSRDRVIAAYGVGSGRAQRLRSMAEDVAPTGARPHLVSEGEAVS